MPVTNPFRNLSKPQLYAVVGGGTLIAFYAEYRHHKLTGSWSPFATGTTGGSPSAIDPVTNLPYSEDAVTDPITGQAYLAEAQQYGSVAAAEAVVSAYGQSTATGSGIPVNPASPVSGGSVNTPVGTSIYTSNAAWAQAVQAGLSSVSGSQQYDGTDIGEALGAYLQGMPLSPDQIKVVSTAIAEYGPPPVGSFQIIPGPATPPTPPATGGGALAFAVPNGQGGWMNASFPNQDAVAKFYTSLGIVPGSGQGYPNGLGTQQIIAAVTNAGGTVTGAPSTGGGGGDHDRR